MIFRWSDYVQRNDILKKLQEQGNDTRNIPVRIEGYELRDNQLVAIIEPNISIKNNYQLNAKKDCKNCKGYGYIRYFFDQDDVKAGPCWICFPYDKRAQDWKKQIDYNERY